MDQLVHLPWFLAKYQQWWTIERMKLVAELDVAILILRVCSYASQFLPSPGFTLDNIRGVPIVDVRKTCDEVAESLATISTAANGRGSLIRVQYLAFFGLQRQIEGKTIAFWKKLSHAIRVAQSIGLHSDVSRSRQGVDETCQEMERRTFCNLYIWDSLLSRQLDVIAILPGCLRPGNWPQSHLLGSGGEGDIFDMGADAPDLFTERLLQARLAEFWRSIGPVQGTEYDMMAAEERYGKFCYEYLSQLPPTFALVDPDERWDKHFPKLPLQRQLLHIAIYDSLCWNFRPLLLLQDCDSMESLPVYKRVLLGSQKMALAVAALHAMEGVTQLHALLGGCHTRYAGLVFSTFEAAVLLVYLYMDPTFPRDCQPRPVLPAGAPNTTSDPLQAGIGSVTQQGCVQAVQGALKRLRMLAEVSSMADAGAKTLTRLLSKVSETRTAVGTDEAVPGQNQEVGTKAATSTTSSAQLGASSAVGEAVNWPSSGSVDSLSMKDFMPVSTTSAVGDIANWPSFDLPNINAWDDFNSMRTTQDIQSTWATPPMMEFSHQNPPTARSIQRM